MRCLKNCFDDNGRFATYTSSVFLLRKNPPSPRGEGFLFSPKPKFCGGKSTKNLYLVVSKNSEKFFEKMQKNACILRLFAVL